MTAWSTTCGCCPLSSLSRGFAPDAAVGPLQKHCGVRAASAPNEVSDIFMRLATSSLFTCSGLLPRPLKKIFRRIFRSCDLGSASVLELFARGGDWHTIEYS